MKLSRMKITISSFLILAIILLGISTSAVGSVNYQTTIAKGTDDYVINQYNETAWISTVDSLTNPSVWFEGEANIIDAKSKITVKGWVSASWRLYNALRNIFMPAQFTPEETFILLGTENILGIMGQQGYNETVINANYTTTYNLWYGLRSVWNFTSSAYDEDPSYTDGVFVLQEPSDYATLLDDYNDLINGNMVLQMLGFQTFTADEFLWQLVINGFAIASPQSDYLSEIVVALGSVNASASGSSLTFERYGVTDYIVEISYGSKGTLSSFTVKDISEFIIFRLTSSNSNWMFFTILITASVSALLIIGYMIYKGRKLKKR